jgi:hypothetical protein
MYQQRLKLARENSKLEEQANLDQRARWTALGADLKTFSTNATVAYAAGTAGLLSMVAAASPSHFATLTGSFQLVASAIGQSLLPYITELSRWVYSVRVYWEGLSDATKSSIARFAVAGVTLAGIIATAGGLIRVFGLLSSSVVSLGRVLTLGLLSNPILAGIVGLTAAVVALAYATGLVGSNARDSTGALVELDEKGRPKPKKKAETAITREQQAALPEGIRTQLSQAAGDTQRMGRILADAEKQQQALLAQSRQATIAPTPEQMDRIVQAGQQAMNRGQGIQGTAAALREAGLQGTEQEIAEFLRQQRAEPGRGHVQIDPGELGRFVEQRQARFMGPFEQALHAIRGIRGNMDMPEAYKPPMQSRFMDYAAYGQAIQEAAFREDSQELRLMQDHLQALQESKEILQDLRGFARAQEQAMQVLFRGL